MSDGGDRSGLKSEQVSAAEGAESGKVDTMPKENWRDEPLEQLLLLITTQPLQPKMLALIDLQALLEQLKPAIDVLHFGGRVIGPAEAAVLDAMKELTPGRVHYLYQEGYEELAQAELDRRAQQAPPVDPTRPER